MFLGNRIKQLRMQRNMTQEELAKKIGYKSKTTITKIENGTNDIVQSKVCDFAKALNTTPAYLMGWEEPEQPTPKSNGYPTVRIPVLGDVAAGVPILAQQDIIGTEEIPAEWAKKGEYFGLKIRGDSMEPRIHNGSTVIVKVQNDANNNEIVIVMIEDEATCKKFHKYSDIVVLNPINANYEPIILDKNSNIKILGKVVRAIEDF
ncbi:MAG: XRE family transcriptional regulator [Lachnospiraceae bacterium]|nr:XRE family transcriptional regulator [Lachnospiraceae bacterium]